MGSYHTSKFIDEYSVCVGSVQLTLLSVFHWRSWNSEEVEIKTCHFSDNLKLVNCWVRKVNYDSSFHPKTFGPAHYNHCITINFT